MKHAFVTVLAIFGLAANCRSSETEDSTNVNQDRIYQSYKVEYNANTGQFGDSAFFALGGPTGTTLELVGSSSITVDGNAMRKLSSLGTSYGLATTAAFSAAPHVFIWTDSNGKAFTNSVTPVEAVIPSTLGTFAKSAGVTVSWGGTPLSATEDRVEVSVSGHEGNASATSTQSNGGATSVALTAAGLASVPAGTVTVMLTRYATDTNCAQFTAVGGLCSTSYTSKTTEVQMTD